MGRNILEVPALHPTPGYSHAAIAAGSRLVFFAGQVALDPGFRVIGGEDLHAQTVAAMRNLGTALRAAGGTWDDIVRRTIYTTRPTQFQVIAAAIAEVTGSTADPPQTIAGVNGLALPELLIEIEATAAIK